MRILALWETSAGIHIYLIVEHDKDIIRKIKEITAERYIDSLKHYKEARWIESYLMSKYGPADDSLVVSKLNPKAFNLVIHYRRSAHISRITCS